MWILCLTDFGQWRKYTLITANSSIKCVTLLHSYIGGRNYVQWHDPRRLVTCKSKVFDNWSLFWIWLTSFWWKQFANKSEFWRHWPIVITELSTVWTGGASSFLMAVSGNCCSAETNFWYPTPTAMYSVFWYENVHAPEDMQCAMTRYNQRVNKII